MRVLGIDTSLRTGAVGLIDGVHVLFEDKMTIRPGGGEKMPALIQRALQAVGWRPDYLDLIAVGRGPGSYTGVRIGLAIAKGMAYSLGIPLVGINTLLALAANNPGWPGLLCPLLDSRRGTVYAGLYIRKEWSWVELRPPEIWPVPELAAFLGRQKPPILFLGDGALMYRKELATALGPGAVFRPEKAGKDEVKGAVLACLGLVRRQEREENELFTCLPLYLRRTEAEMRWEERRITGDGGN